MTRKTNAATAKTSGAEAPVAVAVVKDAPLNAPPVATNDGAPTDEPATSVAASKPPRDTKLRTVEALLRRDGGASIADLMTVTGWQQHSVRGMLAGTLKRKGLVIASLKVDGVRRYHIAASA